MRVSCLITAGLTVLAATTTTSALPNDKSQGETAESSAVSPATSEPRGNVCETMTNHALCCKGVGPIRVLCDHAIPDGMPVQPPNVTVFKNICGKQHKDAKCCWVFLEFWKVGFSCYEPYDRKASTLALPDGSDNGTEVAGADLEAAYDDNGEGGEEGQFGSAEEENSE